MKTLIFFIIFIINGFIGIYMRYPTALIFAGLALAVSFLFLFEKDVKQQSLTKNKLGKK